MSVKKLLDNGGRKTVGVFEEILQENERENDFTRWRESLRKNLLR